MWSNHEFDRQMARAERSYLEEPTERERDDNELWLRADDDAEERWFEKLREGDI